MQSEPEGQNDRPPSHRLGVWPDWLEWVIPCTTHTTVTAREDD